MVVESSSEVSSISSELEVGLVDTPDPLLVPGTSRGSGTCYLLNQLMIPDRRQHRRCRSSTSRQTIRQRPVSHPPAQRQRRHPSAIFCHAVQPLSLDGLDSDIIQSSLYHAASKEARPRFGRPEVLSANRQSVGAVEAAMNALSFGSFSTT